MKNRKMTTRVLLPGVLSLLMAIPVNAQNLVGQWTFDDSSDPYKPTVGSSSLVPNYLASEASSVVEKSVAGITANDGAREVGKFTYYECAHGIAANGGGQKVNQYSIMYDMKIPKIGEWHSLFQGNSTNKDDADVFIKNNETVGCGTMDYSTSKVTADKWMRIVVSMNLGSGEPPKIYIDGKLVHTGAASKSGNYVKDGKYFAWDLNKILIFGDNDTDYGTNIISQLAIWDGALSGAQIAMLGNAGDPLSTTPPETSVTEIGSWEFNDQSNPLKASKGKDLLLEGTQNVVSGPVANKFAGEIAVGSYYTIDLADVTPNGGGTMLNDWTLQMDVKRPLVSDGKGFYTALFQTSATNANDADLFLDKDGRLGNSVSGYTSYGLVPDEWHRLVISYVCSEGKYYYYIDGGLARTGSAAGIAVDGRFAPSGKFLIGADNDGEDGKFQVSNIRLWAGKISEKEIAELAGYGHKMPQEVLYLYPFMYNPCATEATISWHDSNEKAGTLEYGTTNTFGNTVSSTSAVIEAPYIWHTAQLSGLTANTTYYYRIKGEKGTSDTYTFKTLPEDKDVDVLRFMILGDTHNNPVMSSRIISKAKEKIEKVYGNSIENCIQFIAHTGDVVDDGNIASQYTTLFFNSMRPFSPHVPMLICAGNHEKENASFYKYVSNEKISAQAEGHTDYERYWSKKIGNILLIGLNSYSSHHSAIAQTIAPGLDLRQKTWLKNTLDAAEADNTVSMVFCFVHECPLGELWGTGGEGYTVKPDIYPLVRQYSKVQQLSYGHTHGYERGISAPLSDNTIRDIALLCDGGAGGNLDRWGKAGLTQIDHPEINISLDQYFFIVGEIDTKNNSYNFKTYSLGNHNKWRDTEVVDQWSGDMNVVQPQTPIASNGVMDEEMIKMSSSEYVGSKNICSAQVQLVRCRAAGSDILRTKLLDVVRDYRNIYNVTSEFEPIDKNQGINLFEFIKTGHALDISNLAPYQWRVRYRDQNRVWSNWSDYATFTLPSNVDINTGAQGITVLYDKYANLFNFILPESTDISEVTIYDMQGKLCAKKETQNAYIQFSGSELSKGVYCIAVKQGNKIYKESFAL